ncbi:hypothetical protein BN13_550017 [Nostocoides jenkinsii Ben 74]|uniref:Uncharacterized protein n=1 Tax=Nostocoides jenkinsii Ben 74 TaxID=1193518 RepID=A0A077MBP9_9MICO|nr:hypothetical protein BN13_550017 [Tetrasphaera jenkinsii Ben 74]
MRRYSASPRQESLTHPVESLTGAGKPHQREKASRPGLAPDWLRLR